MIYHLAEILTSKKRLSKRIKHTPAPKTVRGLMLTVDLNGLWLGAAELHSRWLQNGSVSPLRNGHPAR